MALIPISTSKAPAAVGPYSQGMKAMKAGNIIYTSGQLPIVPETGELLKGDIQKETRLCLENVKAVLEEGNATLKDVVKVSIYITDIKNFPMINEVYEEYFSEHKPARTLVEVSQLPKGGDIEIEAIAIL
ncbi:RidA family protein [Tissierella sp. MSJ-40]|uniref:RidA family protein n=1 Tax=Tissierella simiarum TaxID=2841534 RepID=A0ABS6EB45_9FIRM|nr:RidA family protein [Tissierella simiarum]MBU5440007.1 RidA family protein [Tissierella simiarum]